jgi:quercetin dioxygenase-like cupin family protein
MQIVDYSGSKLERIHRYESTNVASTRLAHGEGEAHTYYLRFGPGSVIGEHPTGFGQLFVVVEGEGWVAGDDGDRVAVRAGQAAYFPRGETHSKGSETGMSVLMIQVRDFALESDEG